MLLVVIPVDLVMLALDLERLDDLLGHHRRDALVFAAVEDEEGRLNALRSIQRRATAIRRRSLRVVRLAHHPLQVDPTGPIAVAIALGDLRVAVQVDAGPPQRWLLGQDAERHVAAVRSPVVGQPAIAPRLGGRPMTGIDDVEGVGVAPLPMVCPTERAAVTGRPAEVDREEGHALLDD